MGGPGVSRTRETLASWGRRLLGGAYLPIRNRLLGSWRAATGPLVFHARTIRLRASVRHLRGPRSFEATSEQMVVVCVVRDGEPWIPAFMSHYASLGATHFVFLDNGSTDRTLELLRSGADNVTVFSCTLPFRSYKIVMKAWLVHTFGRGCWALLADIDELFDYPHSERVPLGDLLRYLNAHRFSAVAAQMLDLFSERWEDPLEPGESLVERCTRYSLSGLIMGGRQDLTRKEMRGTTVAHSGIRMYWGGVRNAWFGSVILLTKHPLLFVSRGVRVRSDHFIQNANVADFTAVLRHYKFVPGLREKVRSAIEEHNYAGDSIHYRLMDGALERVAELALTDPWCRRWRGATALLEEGLLVASGEFGNEAAGSSAISKPDPREEGGG
ncbi:MAG TPA: glycosyltransferase family 2 protein [Thermoanaerobaculia bacterium]|nr:glycosyltransferase family 2 protein [Thermoanaerobaculia bacterium]